MSSLSGIVTIVAGYLFTPAPVESVDTLWLAEQETILNFGESTVVFTTAEDKTASSFQFGTTRFGQTMTWSNPTEPYYLIDTDGVATLPIASTFLFNPNGDPAQFKATDNFTPVWQTLDWSMQPYPTEVTVVSSTTDPTSLAAISHTSITSRLTGKNNVAYSSLTYDSDPYILLAATRNLNCWATGLLSLTAVPVGKSFGGETPNPYVLVAPDIVLGIGHNPVSVELNLYFVTDDNQVIVRALLPGIYYTGGGLGLFPPGFTYSDTLMVRRLASPVPSSIRPMKVFTTNINTKYANAALYGGALQEKNLGMLNPYIAYFNQFNRAAIIRAKSGYLVNNNGPEATSFWASRVAGDSGHPMCLVVGNELVFYSTVEGADMKGQYAPLSTTIEVVRAGATALGSAYANDIAEYDLSAYPAYTYPF